MKAGVGMEAQCVWPWKIETKDPQSKLASEFWVSWKTASMNKVEQWD